MKKLIYILLILTSCAIPDDNNVIEKIPDQKIFEQAYFPYWEKQERTNYIYHKYAVLEDTAAIKKMVYYLKYEKGDIPFFTPMLDINFPYLGDNIDNSIFRDFEILDKKDISKLLSDEKNNKMSFYAVTKPFRIDTTNCYLIQEYRLPYNLGCINKRRTDLVFEYVNGEFKVLYIE